MAIESKVSESGTAQATDRELNGETLVWAHEGENGDARVRVFAAGPRHYRLMRFMQREGCSSTFAPAAKGGDNAYHVTPEQADMLLPQARADGFAVREAAKDDVRAAAERTQVSARRLKPAYTLALKVLVGIVAKAEAGQFDDRQWKLIVKFAAAI